MPKKMLDYFAELAEGFSDRVSQDLCFFAKHAKRTTITAEDVRLCARNNPSVTDILDVYARDHLQHSSEGERGPAPVSHSTIGISQKRHEVGGGHGAATPSVAQHPTSTPRAGLSVLRLFWGLLP